MKYKAIIIEDEEFARKRLTRLLANFNDLIEIVAEASNGEEGLALTEKHQPTLIFLDIEMPVLNGFELLKQLSYQPYIVFTTAYDEYAIKAFEKNSVDYLLKPIELDRLKLTIEKLRTRTVHDLPLKEVFDELELKPELAKNHKSIPVKIGDKIILISFDEIAYFQANDKYVELFDLKGNAHLLEWSLNSLEAKLPAQFVRIHRSTLVNMDMVKEFRKGFNSAYFLILKDANESKLSTGKTYTDNIRKWIQW